jgi:hypothetical protein
VEEDGVEKSTQDLTSVLAVEYLCECDCVSRNGAFQPVQQTHNVYRYCRMSVHGVSVTVNVDANASANTSTTQQLAKMASASKINREEGRTCNFEGKKKVVQKKYK